MCKECDKRNGTNFYSNEEKVEKEAAEKEVSPESNATFTKLTPGPDSGTSDFVATPEGNVPNPSSTTVPAPNPPSQ